MELLKVTSLETTLNLVELEIGRQKYCCMKDEVKHAFFEMQRYEKGDRTGNFTQMLIDLVAKADEFNKRKLLMSFPEVVGAYLVWYYKEMGETKFADDDELFEGVQKRLAE